MTMVPVMWLVWAALVVILAGLYIYRASLSKDEENQIYLDDSFSHERTAQATIVQKINKVQPLLRVLLVVTSVVTVFVIAYYLLDFVHQFK